MRISDWSSDVCAQDCLSTVIELDPEGKRARRVGAMIDFIAVDPSNGPLIAAMSRPEIRIVSLTVTGGGYFITPATGRFDPSAPEITSAERRVGHEGGSKCEPRVGPYI